MSEDAKPIDNSAPDIEPSSDSAVNDPIDMNLVEEEAPPIDTVLDVDADAPESTTTSESETDNTAEFSGETATSKASEAAQTDLEKTIQTLTAQLEDRTGQYMRLAADFDNYRKRTAKEKGEVEERVKRNTIVELLPVIDNFERARSQIKPQNDGETNIQKSYQGIYKQLVDCLKQIGVSPMRPEGELFDPNFHEAVMREPTNDYPDGTVIEELRRGYILGDQVIRHAMVRVAAPAEPESPEPSSAEENSGE